MRCHYRLGPLAPDFEAETTEGPIRFHEWIGDSWAVLFSHPKDFTPVCTTELGYMAKLQAGVRQAQRQDHRPERRSGRQARAVVERHQGDAGPRAELSDDRRHRPEGLEAVRDAAGRRSKARCEGRTAADNQTVRNVFVIGPDKKIKLIIVYPMTTGRNFDEVLRVIDSLQLTAKHKVATPVNWKQGEDVIIAGSVSDDDAKKTYPDGWKSPKPYIRIVPQPEGLVHGKPATKTRTREGRYPPRLRDLRGCMAVLPERFGAARHPAAPAARAETSTARARTPRR